MLAFVLSFFLVGGFHTASEVGDMAHIQSRRPFSLIPQQRSREDELLAAMRLREFRAVPNTAAGASQRKILGEILELEKTASTPQQVNRGPSAATEFVGRQNANVQAINLRRGLAGENPLEQRGAAVAPRSLLNRVPPERPRNVGGVRKADSIDEGELDALGAVTPASPGTEEGIAIQGTGGGRDIRGQAEFAELDRRRAEASKARAEARSAELDARSPLERAQDQAGVAGFNARTLPVRVAGPLQVGEGPSFTGGPQINAERFRDPDFADTQAALEADRQVGGEGVSPGERIANIQAGVSRDRFALQEQMQRFDAEQRDDEQRFREQGMTLRQANELAFRIRQLKAQSLQSIAGQRQDAFEDARGVFRREDPEGAALREEQLEGARGLEVPGGEAGGDDPARQQALQFFESQGIDLSTVDPSVLEEEIQQWILRQQ